eukprot:1063931-Pyramimonas_sp.AAC.1
MGTLAAPFGIRGSIVNTHFWGVESTLAVIGTGGPYVRRDGPRTFPPCCTPAGWWRTLDGYKGGCVYRVCLMCAARSPRRGRGAGVHAAGNRLEREDRRLRVPHSGSALHRRRGPEGHPRAVVRVEEGRQRPLCADGLLQPSVPTAAYCSLTTMHA